MELTGLPSTLIQWLSRSMKGLPISWSFSENDEVFIVQLVWKKVKVQIDISQLHSAIQQFTNKPKEPIRSKKSNKKRKDKTKRASTKTLSVEMVDRSTQYSINDTSDDSTRCENATMTDSSTQCLVVKLTYSSTECENSKFSYSSTQCENHKIAESSVQSENNNKVVDCLTQCESNKMANCSTQCESNKMAECSKQCESNKMAVCSTQYEINKMADCSTQCEMINMVCCSIQCESYDTVDCSTQCESSKMADCSTQCEISKMAECSTQCESSKMADCSTQCGSSKMADCSTQCEINKMADCSTQCEISKMADCSTQCDISKMADCSTQCEISEMADCSIQCEGSKTADCSTQCEINKMADCSIQCESSKMADCSTQFENITTTDSSFQCEINKMADCSTQCESIKTTDCSIQCESSKGKDELTCNNLDSQDSKQYSFSATSHDISESQDDCKSTQCSLPIADLTGLEMVNVNDDSTISINPPENTSVIAENNNIRKDQKNSTTDNELSGPEFSEYNSDTSNSDKEEAGFSRSDIELETNRKFFTSTDDNNVTVRQKKFLSPSRKLFSSVKKSPAAKTLLKSYSASSSTFYCASASPAKFRCKNWIPRSPIKKHCCTPTQNFKTKSCTTLPSGTPRVRFYSGNSTSQMLSSPCVKIVSKLSLVQQGDQGCTDHVTKDSSKSACSTNQKLSTKLNQKYQNIIFKSPLTKRSNYNSPSKSTKCGLKVTKYDKWYNSPVPQPVKKRRRSISMPQNKSTSSTAREVMTDKPKKQEKTNIKIKSILETLTHPVHRFKHFH